MKNEIDYKNCRTIEEFKILVDDYMDYYNNDRYQWNLKKLRYYSSISLLNKINQFKTTPYHIYCSIFIY
ncbi:IS3 family transposase [Romboutsia sp. 13368]|uniref:IS3 family transposase n=1 Tax=Romboutsia sp. 13368 TaxID=2708053 RepID=UPI003FA72FFC